MAERFNILVLNQISASGLSRLPAESYHVGKDVAEHPDDEPVDRPGHRHEEVAAVLVPRRGRRRPRAPGGGGRGRRPAGAAPGAGVPGRSMLGATSVPGRSLIILSTITLSPAFSPSRITHFLPIHWPATTGCMVASFFSLTIYTIFPRSDLCTATWGTRKLPRVPL